MDKKQFELLVQLSSLNVDEGEREGLIEDVNSILGYVNKLQELDLDSVELERDVVAAETYREDEVVPTSEKERNAVLENFPGKTGDDLLEAHAVLDR